MRPAGARLFGLVLALFLAASAFAQEAAPPDLQALYDQGSQAAAEQRFDEARRLLYAGLETLRRAGRGESPDAGMFAAGLADVLATQKDPQADDAYRLAIALLARADDLTPFIGASHRFAGKLSEAGAHDEAIAVTEAMLRRVEAGADDYARAFAIETALGVYGAAGRDADADRVLAGAETLQGNEPEIAYIRGLARGRLARDAQAAGRMADAVAALDASLDDFRHAGDRGRSFLGVFLLLRAQIAFADGEYRPALPLLDEALPILEADPEREEDWTLALSLRGRLLERMDRVADALKLADAEIAAFEKRMGPDSQMASAARLERVEYLLRAGRSGEARAALDKEAERLGGSASPMMASFFFERLAAIEIADGNFPEAAEAAERSIDIRRENFPDLPNFILEAMRLRASASDGLLDLDYGERTYREMIALSEDIFPPNHPELARDLNAFASYLASFRRYDEAEAIERRVVDMLKIAYGADGAKYGYALANLANFIAFNGKADEAVDLYHRSVAIIDRLPDQEDFRALVRINLASTLILVRRFEEALTVAGESKLLHENLPGRAKQRLSAIYGIEMQALTGLGHDREAVAAGRAMLAAAPTSTYEETSNLAVGLTFFSVVLTRDGDPEEGLAMARQAMSILQGKQVGAGGAYRETAKALVGAAFTIAQ